MLKSSTTQSAIRGVIAIVTIFVVWIAVDAFVDAVVFDAGVEINWGLAVIVSIAGGSVVASIVHRQSTE